MAWFLVQGYPIDPSQMPRPDQGLPGPQPPFPGGGRPPGYPDQGLPGPQPIPGWPTVPGWGGSLPGGRPPYPDQGLPGHQPYPDQGLPGRPPGGIWGPTDPRPTHPIYIPIVLPPDPEHPNLPTHPIYLPVYPDQGLPGDQPRPDNTLPGAQPRPDNTLPGSGKPDLVKLKKIVSFLLGNLPTDPNPKPEPV